MSAITKQIWTYTLGSGESINVTEEFGFTDLSIYVESGGGVMVSTLEVNGVASLPVTLVQGVSVNISTSSNSVLTGVKIICDNGGSIALIGK